MPEKQANLFGALGRGAARFLNLGPKKLLATGGVAAGVGGLLGLGRRVDNNYRNSAYGRIAGNLESYPPGVAYSLAHALEPARRPAYVPPVDPSLVQPGGLYERAVTGRQRLPSVYDRLREDPGFMGDFSRGQYMPYLRKRMRQQYGVLTDKPRPTNYIGLPAVFR